MPKLTFRTVCVIFFHVFITRLCFKQNNFSLVFQENKSNTIIVTMLEVNLRSYFVVITYSLSHYLHACRQCAKKKYIRIDNTITKGKKKKVKLSRMFADLSERGNGSFVPIFERESLKIFAILNSTRAYLRSYYGYGGIVYLHRSHGKVFEKEILENTRLLTSVRCSSQFFATNGNIVRYNCGQYSLTNLMAA